MANNAPVPGSTHVKSNEWLLEYGDYITTHLFSIIDNEPLLSTG